MTGAHIDAGSPVSATCQRCSASFSYSYRGGVKRGTCDDCTPIGKLNARRRREGTMVERVYNCEQCRQDFVYSRGGRVPRCCETCRANPPKKEGREFAVKCRRCSAPFTFTYTGGPKRRMCDKCRQNPPPEAPTIEPRTRLIAPLTAEVRSRLPLPTSVTNSYPVRDDDDEPLMLDHDPEPELVSEDSTEPGTEPDPPEGSLPSRGEKMKSSREILAALNARLAVEDQQRRPRKPPPPEVEEQIVRVVRQEDKWDYLLVDSVPMKMRRRSISAGESTRRH